MKTTHKILFRNANNMSNIKDKSVDFMVTSPPYPMIEMWDDIFSKQNPTIGKALAEENGKTAFELMHRELDKVWKEAYRVLKDGGFACINIGDATRKLGEEFRLYPNHSRTMQYCLKLGFNPFPEILWRKQTNAPNKFMGSGMLPAGAYVTLEHEFILVLRKGKKRKFTNDKEKLRRKKSAFFWEERNRWFSDFWEGLKGTKQKNIDKKIRARTGAYPFELAYRLINMFSLKEDTVLDPFLGTGTTTAASMTSGRNSIGIEIDSNLKQQIISRFEDIKNFSNQIIENRIQSHLEFVRERTKLKGALGYSSNSYGFPIMTHQEIEILFDEIKGIKRKGSTFEIEYREKPTFLFEQGKLVRKDKC